MSEEDYNYSETKAAEHSSDDVGIDENNFESSKLAHMSHERQVGLNFKVLQTIQAKDEKSPVIEWSFPETLKGQEENFESFFNSLAQVVTKKQSVLS